MCFCRPTISTLTLRAQTKSWACTARPCSAGEYVTRRKQFKKTQLNWRKSGGVRCSLGWIPLNTADAQWKNGQVYHNGNYLGVWDSYGLSQYKFRSGSFNEDTRGRWYFNVVVDV